MQLCTQMLWTGYPSLYRTADGLLCMFTPYVSCEIANQFSWYISKECETTAMHGVQYLGQLQFDAQSSEGNSFSLYALTLCLAANMCNFETFFHSSTA